MITDRQPTLAVLDGTILFAGYTSDFDYVIEVQHNNDYISQPVERMTVAIVAPFGPRTAQAPVPVRIRSRLVMAGDPAAGRLRTYLGCRPRLARRFALGHTTLLSLGRRNSAPPLPKPRGGPSALAGQEERAGQARCP